MKQALAVAEPTLLAITETKDVLVNVDFSGNVSVDNPFVQVSKGGTAAIRFYLETELSEVFFDNPAITIIGNPKSNFTIERSAGEVLVTWPNTTPDEFGLSFYYRLHLLRQVNETFLPLHHDPIIHNDPPPAP